MTTGRVIQPTEFLKEMREQALMANLQLSLQSDLDFLNEQLPEKRQVLNVPVSDSAVPSLRNLGH